LIYINRLIKKIKSQRGAMDKVLVSLLFVIIAVSSLVLVEKWFSSQRDDLIIKSNNAVTNVMNTM